MAPKVAVPLTAPTAKLVVPLTTFIPKFVPPTTASFAYSTVYEHKYFVESNID